jgi:hypothetical protein
MLVSNIVTYAVNLLYLFWQHKFFISGVFAAYLFACQTKKYLDSPFRKQGIPGPFLAKFTNLYRTYYTIRRTWHRDLKALHEKYGPVIWIAPNDISCADPYLRNQIYGFANEKKNETFFRKAPSYETGSINEEFSFIFERRPEEARFGKKYLAHFYSEAGLIKFEDNFDLAVDGLVQGLDKHIVEPGKVCSLTSWMEYYCLDASCQITSNLSGGFCSAGKDLWNTIYGFRIIVQVIGILMPIPQALLISTRWIRKMLLVYPLDQVYYAVVGIGAQKWKTPLSERVEEIRTKAPNHLLARFYEAQERTRGHFPIGDKTQGSTIQIFNLTAGSLGVVPHTAAEAMHQLIENPDILARVRQELSTLDGDLKFADFLHHNGSNKVPYLEAVVNEAIRHLPSVAFSLARISPPAGCYLNEFFIPPGYIVGMSAWTVNFDTNYFGPDAAEYKPERWLGNHPTEMLDGAPRTMMNYIEAGWLSFGAGGRVCLGRHLAVFLMIKVISKLVMTYDFELIKAPDEYYTLFVENIDMQVKVKRREEALQQL